MIRKRDIQVPAKNEKDRPKDPELTFIFDWDIYGHTIKDLVDHVQSIWGWGNTGFVRIGRWLTLYVGGWSKNETIIKELAKTAFWLLCYRPALSNERCYVFELPTWWIKIPEKKKVKNENL